MLLNLVPCPTALYRAAYLGKPDIVRFFPKTLAADVETVFADEASFMDTDAAMRKYVSPALPWCIRIAVDLHTIRGCLCRMCEVWSTRRLRGSWRPI